MDCFRIMVFCRGDGWGGLGWLERRCACLLRGYGGSDGGWYDHCPTCSCCRCTHRVGRCSRLWILCAGKSGETVWSNTVVLAVRADAAESFTLRLLVCVIDHPGNGVTLRRATMVCKAQAARSDVICGLSVLVETDDSVAGNVVVQGNNVAVPIPVTAELPEGVCQKRR